MLMLSLGYGKLVIDQGIVSRVSRQFLEPFLA